ncbi:ImmA/IrrE family metallo-endopeptidase [Corynebacterium aurimucosum]|uniref:ImmA/IrrE family metallo-endopeptidase n=1 Tax=Corynebacterium aurimucosum TaxID=169292 RepID=A0A558IQ22_9CORY|nr:ImmA/IrrE family metallo-endopeptidase [Corynebacterium aurimucosum]TVU83322.1 ImmA/IrrE family metallo-endopeptidase [Corynebacterium aurimucosum]
MSPIEERLSSLLIESGVELLETGKLDARFNACYHAASRTIIVRTGLDPVTRVCAIAHELGHVVNGDSCSSPRAERLADEWAARNLIDGDLVEEAANYCGGAPSAIAAEVGVTPHLLGIWMQLWESGRIPSYSCMIL